ncbi:hypothetical protein K438DRAFT_1670024 [Mycena galopus ATCC 62051]|nr:hypothetical protein K438DRAFT_1670024 [Mycena galopus ATCC 62051]
MTALVDRMAPSLRLDYLEQNLVYLYSRHLSQYAPHLATKLNSLNVLPCFVALCLLSILVFCSSRLSGHPISNPSDSIQALFTVIAPTSVAWPREYARLVTYSTSSRSKTISISMASLIGRVCDGAIEIRNYGDLPDLFSENLLVYGWHICLALDAAWNFEVLRWVVGNHFSWNLRGSSSKQRPSLKRAHNTSEPKPNGESPFSFSITSNAHLDLDYVPFSRLEPSLLELRATLVPGTFATLEFTAPAPHVSFLSPHFIICAVPFLPRRHVAQIAPNSIHPRTRTATPLQASLHRVLELLTAAPGALALENVSNVSKQYAEGLNKAAEQLEDAGVTRAAFIRQWGEAGWREQRLMMGWEAALFSAGLLTRWLVVVRK